MRRWNSIFPGRPRSSSTDGTLKSHSPMRISSGESKSCCLCRGTGRRKSIRQRAAFAVDGGTATWDFPARETYHTGPDGSPHELELHIWQDTRQYSSFPPREIDGNALLSPSAAWLDITSELWIHCIRNSQACHALPLGLGGIELQALELR